MKNIYSVPARVSSIQRESVPRGLIRIKSDGRSFFAAPTLFDNEEIFSKLTSEYRVHLGVRALADGTFWVYWLHSPELGTAVMPIVKKATSRLSFRLFLPLLCLVGFISQASYARMLVSGIVGRAGALAGMALVISTLILCYLGLIWLREAFQRIREPEREAESTLHSLFLAVQNGDYSSCVPVQLAIFKHSGRDPMAMLLARARCGKAENIQSHFSVMEGKVSDVTLSPTVIGYTAKHKAAGLRYTLKFGETRRSYEIPADSVIPNPASGYSHPFFIAPGDEVRLVVNKRTGEAAAVCNKEDGCVYWDSDGTSPQALRRITKILLFFTPGWQLACWTGAWLWGGISWYAAPVEIPFGFWAKFYWMGVSFYLHHFKSLAAGFGLAMSVGPLVIAVFWLKRILFPPMANWLAFLFKAFPPDLNDGVKAPYFIDTWRAR